MKTKFNIFKEITKLYSIYLSRKDKNFNLKQKFEGEDFFKHLYPNLDEIIDYINNNKKNQENHENRENRENKEKRDNKDDRENICDKGNRGNRENDKGNRENIENKDNGGLSFEINNYSEDNNHYKENVTQNMNNKNYKENVTQNMNNKNYNSSDCNLCDYKNSVIKPLIKKIYKKLAIRCHPDKCSDSEIFVLVSECYGEEILIGLIHFCMELEIDLSFIEINNMFVEYITTEIRYIINKILTK